MVRQYIGARYVPKFDGNWDSSKSYESLTVVKYGNSTYTSKKQVPAGTVPTNTEYWALTGDTNGAILDLEERVIKLENEDTLYNRLHGKTIIVLGDSLSAGSGETVGKTWVDNIASKYGANCYNYSLSGSPVASTDSDSMISRLADILAEHDTCDYFVLSGGANDKNRNIAIGNTSSVLNTNFIGAVKNICANVQNKYKETCKMLCITTFHRYDDVNTLGNTEYDYVDAMLRACSVYGIPCFNAYNNSGISLAERSGSSYNNWADIGFSGGGSTRNYHFSIKGYEYLTPIFASFIATGNAQNGADLTEFETIDGVQYSKTRLGNGFKLVTITKPLTLTMSSIADHIATTGDFTIDVPAKYRVGTLFHVSTTLTSASGQIMCAPSNITSFDYLQTTIRARGIQIYNTLEASITAVFSAEFIGF